MSDNTKSCGGGSGFSVSDEVGQLVGLEAQFCDEDGLELQELLLLFGKRLLLRVDNHRDTSQPARSAQPTTAVGACSGAWRVATSSSVASGRRRRSACSALVVVHHIIVVVVRIAVVVVVRAVWYLRCLSRELNALGERGGEF